MRAPADVTRRDRFVGAALVFVGAVAYGLLATVVRVAYDRGFSPGQVVGAQMTLGSVALWLMAAARGVVRPVGIRAACALMLAGVPTGLTGAFYYEAVHALGSASLAIVLLFQFTWIGVLVECAIERRRPRSNELLSLVCLLVGTVLATGLLEGSIGSLAPIGLAYGVGSAATYTAVIFASGRVEVALDPWLRSAFIGTGAMAIVLALHPPAFLVDGSLTRGLFGLSVATALLGPIGPTVCFAIGVPRIGPSLASIIGAAELPAAMIAASLFLAEPTSYLMWLGVAVILIGIALARRP